MQDFEPGLYPSKYPSRIHPIVSPIDTFSIRRLIYPLPRRTSHNHPSSAKTLESSFVCHRSRNELHPWIWTMISVIWRGRSCYHECWAEALLESELQFVEGCDLDLIDWLSQWLWIHPQRERRDQRWLFAKYRLWGNNMLLYGFSNLPFGIL